MDNNQSNGNLRHADGHNASTTIGLEAVISPYQEGKFNEAAETATQYDKEYPDNEIVLSILSNSQYQLGLLDACISTMERISVLFPTNYKNYNNLGLAYQEAGETVKAGTALRTAIHLNPKYGEAYYNLGNVLFELGNITESIENYEHAITLRPTHVGSHINLGIAKKQEGSLDEAKDCYQAAISIDPNQAEAYYNLGILKLEAGDLEEAVADFGKAIELRPNYSEAYLNLGIVLSEKGNILLAKNIYEKIVSFDPEYPRAHILLGKTHLSLGNEAESTRCFRRVLQIDPSDSEACKELAALSMDKKDYTSAASWYSKSASLSSSVECLKCYFHIDSKENFLPKLTNHITNNPINSSIGALVDTFNFKYASAINNPFCNEPHNYSLNINLDSLIDFEKTFRKPVHEALVGNNLIYRDQKLLTNGRQTAGNIFKLDKIRTSEIEAFIRSELEKYRNRFCQINEGLFREWPEKYTLSGWIVRMKEGGSLSPHIHTSGWLTGSVYINVPALKSNNEGALVLTRGVDYTFDSEDSLVMEVSTGHMCLFPSSSYHCTLPFRGKEERIVLAFDMIPDLH